MLRWEPCTIKDLIFFRPLPKRAKTWSVNWSFLWGGAAKSGRFKTYPVHRWWLSIAPQPELLAQSRLFITHGGHNSVLEALNYGVPMVAIPISDDQPGIAARLHWTGAGELVPLKHLSVNRVRAAVTKVFTVDSYAQQADRLRTSILSAGGVYRAADIIEQVLTIGKPILAG